MSANPSRDRSMSQLLLERRCEVYTRSAGLIMDLEEALHANDGLRARYQLHDLRRCLRSALAFLTEEVYRELERLEAFADVLPSSEGPIPAGAHDELADRLQILHVKLARSLSLPTLQDLEEIVDLPARLRSKMVTETRVHDETTRQRGRDQRCLVHEAEARAHIATKSYARAAKCLRKAIRIDGRRAVFHNDLGVVLSLMNRYEEAISEYRTAIELNEAHATGRTPEWSTTYYNLGVACRKLALEGFRSSQIQAGLSQLSHAADAFERYTQLNATGAKVEEARMILAELRDRLRSTQVPEPEAQPELT
jgi:tetratricopeptide (TPR) repeat protein